MKGQRKLPNRIYKYRDLSSRTLDMVVSDHVYFADPSTFNDPLDTRPSLKVDIDDRELERILRHFVEQRVSTEMSAAAKTIKYRGPKTMDHIERQSRRQADRLIEEIEYRATEPDDSSQNHHSVLLGHYIEMELLRQYDKGIASFAERAICPLMWSHYGDQHRGICIGYSVPDKAASDLWKVRYGGSRLVEASEVAAMIDGDDIARRKVDEAVLMRKAASWGYEREWRLIGRRGTQSSPLELEEIVFGMRCRPSSEYTVAKALESRDRSVKFYEIHEDPGSFKLKKRALHKDDELFIHFPRRSLSTYEAFERLRFDAPSTENE